VCGIIYFNFVRSIIWLHKQGLGLPYFLFFGPKISVRVEFFALYNCWVLRAFAYYNGTENPKGYFYYLFRKCVIIMLCSPFQVKKYTGSAVDLLYVSENFAENILYN